MLNFSAFVRNISLASQPLCKQNNIYLSATESQLHNYINNSKSTRRMQVHPAKVDPNDFQSSVGTSMSKDTSMTVFSKILSVPQT